MVVVMVVYALQWCAVIAMYTVEPLIKDTLNKEDLSIKEKSTHPNSYYTSTF